MALADQPPLATAKPPLPTACLPTSRLSVQVADGVVVIEMTGQIDAAAAAAHRNELLEVCSACVGTLIIAVSGCTCLSSAAVELLRAAHLRCQRRRCQLRVRAEHPAVLDTLVTARLPRTGTKHTTRAQPRGTSTVPAPTDARVAVGGRSWPLSVPAPESPLPTGSRAGWWQAPARRPA
jgi:anti-anti-sigma factor